MRLPRTLAVSLTVAAGLAVVAPVAGARVVHGKVPARAAGFVGGSYDVGGGLRVQISASDSLPDPRAEAQTWATFFKRLVHGSEIGRIRVRVMPVREMGSYCGEDADGCYDGNSELLVIPPTSYANGRLVAAHEYGHHLANNRSNAPWNALDWGTKRWATYENVCARTRAGTAFPGNEDSEYGRDPGETFAEAYAVLNGFEWEGDTYSNTFKPDARALALVRQDVLTPWRRASVTRGSGTLARSERSDRVAIPTPLDGTLRVTADGGTPLDIDLGLYSDAGRLIKRAATDAHRESVGYTVCGTRRLRADVERYRGAGTYALTVARP